MTRRIAQRLTQPYVCPKTAYTVTPHRRPAAAFTLMVGQGSNSDLTGLTTCDHQQASQV